MKKYFIFHAVNPTFTEEQKQHREYVGFVYANSLEQAFQYAQNHNECWAKYGVRSTSVGDVIRCDDTDNEYIVCGRGFKKIEISQNAIQFIERLKDRLRVKVNEHQRKHLCLEIPLNKHEYFKILNDENHKLHDYLSLKTIFGDRPTERYVAIMTFFMELPTDPSLN